MVGRNCHFLPLRRQREGHARALSSGRRHRARRSPARWEGRSPHPPCREGARRISSGGCSTVSADRKSTRLNSSHSSISYAVFCLKKKKSRILNFSQASPTWSTSSL